MKRLLILLISVTYALNIAAYDERERVAVFDPTSSGNTIDAGTKIAIREVISSAIVNTGKYSIVERSMLERVIEEQTFSNSGVVDETQATEIGKLAGANKVIISVVTATGGRIMVSIKMIDVKTAAVEKQRVKIVSPNELINIIEPMTLSMITTAEKHVEPKQQPDAIKNETPVATVPEQRNSTVSSPSATKQKPEIVKETVKVPRKKEKPSYLKNPYDKKGYRGFVSLGGGVDVSSYQGGAVVSFATSHGYQFNPYFFLGAGVGVDYYLDQSYALPVYLDSRVNFINKNITPYFGFKVGYSPIDISGVYINTNLGLSVMVTKKLGLNLALEYAAQNLKITRYYYGYYSSYVDEFKLFFHSMMVKVGIEF